MGNVNSANTPKQETPALNPENQPVLGPVDWSIVLEFLKGQEYENAAKHMSERDEKYKKNLSNMDYGTLMKDRLEHIFKSQIFQSIVDNHFKDATVFSILYFETGGNRDIILEFIFTHAGRTIKQISEETETKVSQKNTLNGLKNYPEIIGQFLNQSMSNILSYSFLLESYDIQNYLKFLKSLQIPKLKPEQTSIQEHCIKFINNFQLTRNMDYFLRLVRLDKIESKDGNNLVSFLSEIAVVVHYVDKYKEFLRAQYEFGVNKLKSKGYVFTTDRENESNKILNINNYVVEPIGLYNVIDNMLPHYASLEKFYISSGLKSALLIEEVVKDETKTSASISDIFSILFASIQRSFSTNPSVIREIISHASSRCSDFAEKLDDRCLRVMPKSLSSFQKNSLFPVYLNDIELSVNYSLKLKLDCENLSLVKFGETSVANDELKLKEFDSISNQFKFHEKKVVCKFCSNYFQKIIVKQLRLFAEYDYKMDVNKYTDAQINDPWVESYINELNAILERFEGVFLDEVGVNIMSQLAKITSTEIIEMVYTKKFSQTGGLQFEREVQFLSEFFRSKIPQNGTFKIRLKKLHEIKEILILEKVDEILDYWNPQSEITWELKETDIRKILKCRVDFRETDINKLKL